MESGKKKETNKFTVIRQNRAARREPADPDFQSDISAVRYVVFERVREYDQISVKRVNFAATRQKRIYFTLRDVGYHRICVVHILFAS